jgi:hypothetical protein
MFTRAALAELDMNNWSFDDAEHAFAQSVEIAVRSDRKQAQASFYALRGNNFALAGQHEQARAAFASAERASAATASISPWFLEVLRARKAYNDASQGRTEHILDEFEQIKAAKGVHTAGTLLAEARFTGARALLLAGHHARFIAETEEMVAEKQGIQRKLSLLLDRARAFTALKQYEPARAALKEADALVDFARNTLPQPLIASHALQKLHTMVAGGGSKADLTKARSVFAAERAKLKGESMEFKAHAHALI